MRIDELADRVGLTPRCIKRLKANGIIPRARGYGRWSEYGPEHVAAARAWLALRHHNTTSRDLAVFLREENITIVEYADIRHKAMKSHGLGVA